MVRRIDDGLSKNLRLDLEVINGCVNGSQLGFVAAKKVQPKHLSSKLLEGKFADFSTEHFLISRLPLARSADITFIWRWMICLTCCWFTRLACAGSSQVHRPCNQQLRPRLQTTRAKRASVPKSRAARSFMDRRAVGAHMFGPQSACRDVAGGASLFKAKQPPGRFE